MTVPASFALYCELLKRWADMKLATRSIGGYVGNLVLSRTSALVPKELGTPVGLHLVFSFDGAKVSALSDEQQGDMLRVAFLAVKVWQRENEVPGSLALAQQEYPWGKQDHFHVHFYIAVLDDVRDAGYEPVRYVDPDSRVRKIVQKAA